MTGYAGLSGSAGLAEKHARELAGKLPAWLIRMPAVQLAAQAGSRREDTGEECPVPGTGSGAAEEAEDAAFREAVCRVPVGEGGVLEALWHLADAARDALGWPYAGVDISLEAIPIRQETIEICEVLGADPYRIPSGGNLVVMEDGWRTSGRVIGHLTRSKKRILRGREGIRYLNRPEDHRADTPEGSAE